MTGSCRWHLLPFHPYMDRRTEKANYDNDITVTNILKTALHKKLLGVVSIRYRKESFRYFFCIQLLYFDSARQIAW